MDKNIDPEKLLLDLQSADPMILMEAMDAAVDLIGCISKRAVPAIENQPVGLFVAERLYMLIDKVMKDLESFLSGSARIEEKAHAGAVRLFFGSQAGVPFLQQTVEAQSGYSMWAAHKLANAGITEAQGAIIRRLRRTDPKNTDEVRSFLSALNKLHGSLPPDLEIKLLSDDTPAEVRELVQTEWPHPAAYVERAAAETGLRV